MKTEEQTYEVHMDDTFERRPPYLVPARGYWSGPYYERMSARNFHIFRPPSTEQYIRKYRELKQMEQDLIDKRWNLWHDSFKRKFFYRVLTWCYKLMMKRGLI